MTEYITVRFKLKNLDRDKFLEWLRLEIAEGNEACFDPVEGNDQDGAEFEVMEEKK